jgi:hypothetical protein
MTTKIDNYSIYGISIFLVYPHSYICFQENSAQTLKQKNMIYLIRGLMMVMVTAMITLFVVDFQSVIDGFTAVVDGVSLILSPLKAVVR